MLSYSDKNIVQRATELLRGKGILSASEINSDRVSVDVIASDGSTRRFWRFSVGDRQLCIVVAPLTMTEKEKKESRSAWYIGNHLYQKGCSVPEIYGWHEESGMLIFEDLGNKRLHSFVVPENGTVPDPLEIKAHYREVIYKLVHMQVEGAIGFDPEWCWDGGHYDKELMVKRESGYFLHAFWTERVQQTISEGALYECEHLAECAVHADAGYFLHRDFQSRNIMIAGGEPRFIDFQGGRFGPLGYDLASLLIDPYCALDYSMQEEFEDVYRGEITKYVDMDSTLFHKEYLALALQRNLQIIGAFSFLSQVRGKSFFAGYLQPALRSAQSLLENPLFGNLPLLKKMIDRGLNLL